MARLWLSPNGGLRLRGTATLDSVHIPLTIDIGFGDATEPGLSEIELPVLLGAPAPKLRAYVAETVIAEKFQAMVMLGRANSRMKDFSDIWMLAKVHRFEGDRLPRAIKATFARRTTEIPADLPAALTQAFANDPAKQKQWADFVTQLGHGAPGLNEVLANVVAFLMPHAERGAHTRVTAPEYARMRIPKLFSLFRKTSVARSSRVTAALLPMRGRNA